MASGSEYRDAADGWPARVSGEWAIEKLYYVDRYMRIFTQSMSHHWRLVYLDLLAGPGRCVTEDGACEFDGSPVLAVKTTPPFTTIVAVEAEPALVEGLRARLQPAAQARVLEGDCNAPGVIQQLRAEAHQTGTLTLAFLDMLGTDVTFETIRALSAHCRMDLLITLQINDLVRNADLARGGPQRERFDAFFGTDAWVDVVQQQTTRQMPGTDLATALMDLYVAQLATIEYAHVYPLQRVMRNTTQAPLYRLLLASKHLLGAEFFGKISAIESSGQRGLPL